MTARAAREANREDAGGAGLQPLRRRMPSAGRPARTPPHSQPRGQSAPPRPARGSAAKRVLEIGAATQRLARKLLAVARPYASEKPTSGVDKRGWLWLEVHGQGRRGRRLPARTDD